MKKIIFSLAFATAILSSAFTYAATNEPTFKVKQAFSSEFTQAKEVEWITMDNSGVYQATFRFNNETLHAFYNEEGEFLGTTRQIVKTQLPIMVVSNLDKQYADAHIVTIFEYSKKDGLDYYITLTTSKGTMIVKATANGDMSVYKKNYK